MGLSRTVSEIKAIAIENRKFLHPVYLTPLREFPLEFCNGGSTQNTRVMPLLDGERV